MDSSASHNVGQLIGRRWNWRARALEAKNNKRDCVRVWAKDFVEATLGKSMHDADVAVTKYFTNVNLKDARGDRVVSWGAICLGERWERWATKVFDATEGGAAQDPTGHNFESLAEPLTVLKSVTQPFTVVLSDIDKLRQLEKVTEAVYNFFDVVCTAMSLARDEGHLRWASALPPAAGEFMHTELIDLKTNLDGTDAKNLRNRWVRMVAEPVDPAAKFTPSTRKQKRALVVWEILFQDLRRTWAFGDEPLQDVQLLQNGTLILGNVMKDILGQEREEHAQSSVSSLGRSAFVVGQRRARALSPAVLRS